jgi:hypothetical protein
MEKRAFCCTASLCCNKSVIIKTLFMNQQTATPLCNQQPGFTIIKGGLFNSNIQLSALTNVAWQVAYTALWNGLVFSDKEIADAKTSINNFILLNGNNDTAYSEFVQRVLLARNYILNNPGKYIPIPTVWLNEDNTMGFAGTKRWFDKLIITRASFPDCKKELPIFAKAILMLHENYSAINFHYWRSYFVEHEEQRLLNLLLSIVANSFYDM